MNKSSSTSPEPTKTALTFDDLYARIVTSTVLADIWKTAFGAEYPTEASPFSFITRTDLDALAQALALGLMQHVVDLGCGCGGPGLFLAQQSGASLTGVDSSAVAVAQAQARARRLGLESRAIFQQADAAATTLASGSFDGALCIDALQMMPEPKAVLDEMARLLRPGGKIGITTWTLSEPWRGRAVVPDYRPLLEASGFDVLAHTEPDGWKERQLRVYKLIRARQTKLVAEVGSEAGSLLLGEAERAPDALTKSTRIRLVGQLRSEA